MNVQQDDAYIFYTYAGNISSGNGYVFNAGERINATTSPLYTCILAFLSFIFHNRDLIPGIAHVLGALSVFFISFLLFKITNRDELYPTQYFLPLLFLTNPLLRNAVGMETFLTLLLITLTLFLYLRHKVVAASVMAGLAILSRFDAVMFAGVLIAEAMIMRKTAELRKSIIVIFLIIMPWFIFSYFYFGELLPSTVKIKLLQSITGYWGRGFIFLKGMPAAFPGGKVVACFYICTFVIAVLIIIMRKRIEFLKQRELRLIITWLFLYFIAYCFILNPPPYPWYFTPFAILFAVGITLLLKEMLESLKPGLLLPVIILIVAIGTVLPIKSLIKPMNSKYVNYKAAADWINNNSEDPVVAIDEIGVLGYYLKKGKVRDILGLVNPDTWENTASRDLPEFIRWYKPDFIVADYPDVPEYLQYLNIDEFRKYYSRDHILGTGERRHLIYRKQK